MHARHASFSIPLPCKFGNWVKNDTQDCDRACGLRSCGLAAASMAPGDSLLAVQFRRIASLSHSTTLIIEHNDSETAADATRQALRLHRAGRRIEVLKDGFTLVNGDGSHAPATADARVEAPPTQPTDSSLSSGSSGGSNSSNSPSENGEEVVEVVEEPQPRRRELLMLASDRGFRNTEPRAAKRRRATAGEGTEVLSRGNWVPWVATEQGGTTQGARGHPGRRQASGAQREHGARGSGPPVGVEEARERRYYAQQEREQTQALEEEAAAQHQRRARLGASLEHADNPVDTPPTVAKVESLEQVPRPPRTNHQHPTEPTLAPSLIPPHGS